MLLLLQVRLFMILFIDSFNDSFDDYFCDYFDDFPCPSPSPSLYPYPNASITWFMTFVKEIGLVFTTSSAVHIDAWTMKEDNGILDFKILKLKKNQI